jgi:hypothetical protein
MARILKQPLDHVSGQQLVRIRRTPYLLVGIIEHCDRWFRQRDVS